MLILHDSAISRSKLLAPVPKKEWMSPSLSSPRDQFGNETVKYMFAVSAKSNDGAVIWKGWFDDREDFDAFLWALVNKTLKYEKALWDLPTPNWQPYLGELITYEFATFSFLTTAGTTQTFNVPTDFNSLNNIIHCVGAGGWGSKSQYISNYYHTGGGGGGGAYARKNNVSLTKGGTCQYFVAASSITAISSNTWFNGVTGTNCAVADSGDGALTPYERTGTASTTTVYQNSGGLTASSIGDVTYAGGSGGTTFATYLTNAYAYYGGGGGGGGAGYYGAGGAGGTRNGGTYEGGGGGGADGGSAGQNASSGPFPAGGNNRLGSGGGVGDSGTNGGGGGGGYYQVATSFNGGMETTASYFNSSYGIGGGGGGGGANYNGSSPTNRFYFGVVGGTGAAYGGAGGGASIGSNSNALTAYPANRSTGGQGLAVVEYTPAIPGGFNSPMLGM
jgi:hypothetical protein